MKQVRTGSVSDRVLKPSTLHVPWERANIYYGHIDAKNKQNALRLLRGNVRLAVPVFFLLHGAPCIRKSRDVRRRRGHAPHGRDVDRGGGVSAGGNNFWIDIIRRARTGGRGN